MQGAEFTTPPRIQESGSDTKSRGSHIDPQHVCCFVKLLFYVLLIFNISPLWLKRDLLGFLEKEDVDALINSVTKNVGFSQGKPVAAFTIYKCLLHWKSFEAERTNVFDRLVQMIGSAIKVLKWDAVLSTSVQIWFLSDLND